MIARSIAIGLAIALAVSVVGNVALGDAWLKARDAHLLAESARAQSVGVAQACSAGTARLELEVKRRDEEGRQAIATAQAKSKSHQGRAQEILSAPPAVPGDACASAGAAIDAWLQGRVQK